MLPVRAHILHLFTTKDLTTHILAQLKRQESEERQVQDKERMEREERQRTELLRLENELQGCRSSLAQAERDRKEAVNELTRYRDSHRADKEQDQQERERERELRERERERARERDLEGVREREREREERQAVERRLGEMERMSLDKLEELESVRQLLVRRSNELQELTMRMSEQTEERAREAAVWQGRVGALEEERDSLVREVTRLGRGGAHVAAAEECLLECADEIARMLQRVQEQGARAREAAGQLHRDKAAAYASLQRERAAHEQERLEHQGVNTRVAEHISGMDTLAIALEALLAETCAALPAAAQRARAVSTRDGVGSRQEPGVSAQGAAGHGDREEVAKLRDQLRMAQDRLEVPPSST